MNFRRIAAVIALMLAASVLGAAPARADLDTIRHDAEAGNAAAQYHLGILYEFGFNLADHDIQAMVWYTLAADHGNKQAIKRRDLLSARLTPAQKEEVARELAAEKARMSAAPAASPPATEPQSGSSGAPALPAGGPSQDGASEGPAPQAAPSPAKP